MAKKKIAILAGKIKIAENKQANVLAAANHKKILDFEDGLEYYAAQNAGCQCIITEDSGDFYLSDIEVLNSESFLNKYVLNQRLCTRLRSGTVKKINFLAVHLIHGKPHSTRRYHYGKRQRPRHHAGRR